MLYTPIYNSDRYNRNWHMPFVDTQPQRLLKKLKNAKTMGYNGASVFKGILPYISVGIQWPGFRSREPAIKTDGSETLRHPVDIL